MEKKGWKLTAILLSVIILIPITLASSIEKSPKYEEVEEGVYEKSEVTEVIDLNKLKDNLKQMKEQKDWFETSDDYYNECVQMCYKDCEIMTETEIASLMNTIDSLETEIVELEKELSELKK